MKNIEFIPAFDFVQDMDIEAPRPSYNFVPDWYKKLNTFRDGVKLHRKSDGSINLTGKACVPLLDSIISGYIITLPCDITFVDPNIYGNRVIWEAPWEVITAHSEDQLLGIPLSDEYESGAYKFQGLWRIKCPKNYSLLYTHPFWHFELPFLTTTAIVDSDLYDVEMNIPFFIKRNFKGTIEKGTPIAQIIPIKRETWKSKIKPYDKKFKNTRNNIRLKVSRAYKSLIWQKKIYL